MNSSSWITTYEPRNCPAHGHFEQKIIHRGEQTLCALPCPECAAEAEAQRRIAEVEKRRQEQIRAIHSRSAIPEDYKTLTPDQLKPAVARWIGTQPSGASLVLLGITGNGKSSQGCCALRVLADRGLSVLYTSALQIVTAMNTSMRFNSDVKTETIIRDFAYPQILFIDDFSPLDTHQNKLLSMVIERRYQCGLSMIVSTNSSPLELLRNGKDARFGLEPPPIDIYVAQMLSRLRDRGHWITVTDPSYRQAAVEESA